MLTGWLPTPTKKPWIKKYYLSHEPGEIMDLTGLNFAEIIGTQSGDVIKVSDSTNVTISSAGGGDIIDAINMTGTIKAGGDADLVNAMNFDGVLDLGAGDGDMAFVENSHLTLNGAGGADILDVKNSTGTINAGTGGDILSLTNFSGIVDLGNDGDADLISIYGSMDGITLRNFDETDGDVLFHYPDVIA